MLDADALIQAQLSSKQPGEFTSNGAQTFITPTRYVPARDDAAASLSLDGTWQVKRWPFDDEAALVAPGAADAEWEAVPQPGCVFYGDPEEDSTEVPGWNRVTLAHIDERDGAVMRRRVTLPAAWEGQRIYLRFDAIFPAGVIYCNGHRVGEQMSGLTPIEWDVTDIVTPGGTALVAVRLLRKHRFVQLDMPRHALEFAGLAQSACFFAVQPCHIADYHLVSELSEDLATATLTGTVDLRNAGDKAVSVALSCQLLDGDKVVATAPGQTLELAAGESLAAPVALSLASPKLWNDEYPNLYQVRLQLTSSGQAPQTVTYRTGFRRFVVAKGRATLNGAPVKFRGVNHLTYHPEHGMHTPREWLRQCLLLMKKANVNAIRTHFLGARDLADLCDEIGIYLLQELPIDWGTNYIHDPLWVGPAMTRLEGGVRRDRHHCSVMVWSVGNENMPQDPDVADEGWHHMRTYDRFVKTLDPSRPTMFPPPGPANKIEGIFEVRVGDIADIHYSFQLVREFNETNIVTNPRSWKADMETTTREEAMSRGWSGTWFSSEYGICNFIPDLLHAPYLSIITDTPEEPLSGENTLEVFYRRLSREWGYMRDDPTCLGGAYFPWICSGTGNNPWGWTRWGEDADWGVVCADLTPKPQFWALRVLFSPIQFPERVSWRPGQTEISFQVTNHYNAIDLSECTLRTMQTGGGRYMAMMRGWKDVPMKGAPGETVTITIPIWNEASLKGLEAGNAFPCRCIFLDPSGFRPFTADVLVVPEEVTDETTDAMPVGPDAEL